MRKVLKTNGRGLLAAVTLTVSIAAFGCTTNQNRGSGEPGVSANPAGTSTPAASSTPGTSSGSASIKPVPMVSAAVDATVDAVAVLEADEGYRGKVLGPAAPATSAQQQTSASGQQVTGQYMSSAPAAVVTSGAGDGVTAGPTTVAPSPLTTGVVSPQSGSTGLTAAPLAPGNAVATPITGTVAPRVEGTAGQVSTGSNAPATTRGATPSVTATGTPTQGTRIVTGADGRQVMTNTTTPARSRLRRMTDALRITRPATTTAPAETTTTP